MIKHAGLPKSYWAEAATVAVYLKNRLIHRILGKTPYEALHGSKPDVSHLRTFGCLAYAHNPIRQKLDDRARRCIFLGYTETTSIWRLFDLDTKKVLRSRDVKFDENTLYKDVIGSSSKDNTSKPTTKTQSPPIALPYLLDDGPIATTRTPAAEIPPAPLVLPKPRRIRDDLSIDMKGWQPAGGGTTRSGRQRDRHAGDDNDRALLTKHLMSIALYAEEGPTTFRDTLASGDAEAWHEAIANEMSALEGHQETQLVPISEAWKTLQWISDVLQANGHVLCHRPVILGDNQCGIGVLNSGTFNSNSHHMRFRYQLVDVVKNRLPEVAYISTKEMKADGLTKALDGMKHGEFVMKMGLG
jgi:hypothetical protein